MDKKSLLVTIEAMCDGKKFFKSGNEGGIQEVFGFDIDSTISITKVNDGDYRINGCFELISDFPALKEHRIKMLRQQCDEEVERIQKLSEPDITRRYIEL